MKRTPTAAVLLAVLLLTACGTDSSEPTSVAEGATATTVEHPGREEYLLRCAGCHSTLGAAATGPTWLGLAGSEVTLESGEIVVADDDYLRRSIVDPNAQIVAGFEPDVMPDFFAEKLTEEDITNLIGYIKSLD